MSDNSATYTVSRMGNGTALHLADERGILCNRWGSTNGTVKALKPVEGAEATCKRCLKLAADRNEAEIEESFDRVDVTDAQHGDELLQAGKWVEIDSVHVMTCSSNVVIRFVGGGSMSMPVSHKPAVRRRVVSEAASIARVTGSVAATVTHERRNEDGSLTTTSVESFERVADQLDGATLPVIEGDELAELVEQERIADERAEREIAEQIKREQIEHEQRIADVRRFYGDEAAQLLIDGWTLDSALAHIEDVCDRELCTHPTHREPTIELSPQEIVTLARRELSCIVHGSWGDYCGPECTRLTKLWNEAR